MKHKRLLSALLAAVLVLCAFCSCNVEEIFGDLPYAVEEAFKPDLLVHFLDVGQGDSIFVELPNGKTMLIDTGENYHGEAIIDYISQCGYKRIDYLVGTHPHSDHIGSMSYLVRNFKIGSIYMPKVSSNAEMYKNLLKSIKKQDLTVKNPRAGLKIIRGEDFSARVIGPLEIDKDNLNNCSLVIRLDYRDTSFLFTGDAEKEELESINADMNADVLKVGHHGSTSSTNKAFLERVRPQIAVISCGENNDYGHPHQATLRLLKNEGCDVYRTDRDGTVTVYTDGYRIGVDTNGKSIGRAKN